MVLCLLLVHKTMLSLIYKQHLTMAASNNPGIMHLCLYHSKWFHLNEQQAHSTV
jgi:hypothetical protein